ncbi:Small lysine-rich protein 1 [Orchesella cincta]|uniref:Small lysine-rich protein 1 n=1 Tax=Orchesella cincta TaxID=48709 RepID=A0A1D2ND67_ORCCI|nr:Small lysine-rich protein 1 [Orchesella cincta]
MPKKGKGRKGKKGRKKKEPRCPVKRRKKAIKKKCTNVMERPAILNSYYVCHGVQDMLKFRKFIWKKKKK